tara:strand:+ start:3380 stop:3562 length:183 start_codon:yes stop_codon:yes gene_type:complete
LVSLASGLGNAVTASLGAFDIAWYRIVGPNASCYGHCGQKIKMVTKSAAKPHSMADKERD